MPSNFPDAETERRAAHMRRARERARSSSEVRLASVVGAHGALLTSLRRGAFQAHEQLDEESLIPMFSASRNSIRGALKLLADEGLVSRSPRLGTAVVAQMLDVPLDIGSGWGPSAELAEGDGEDDADAGREVDYELVVTDDRWVASTPVSRRSLRTTADRVHQVEATNRVAGKPALLYTRFTLAEGPGRPMTSGPEDGDFGALFERTYGSPLGRVECWVEAKAASRRAAARLEVEPGTPLIVKSRVLEDADGVPREYSISHYLASRINMTAHAFGEPASPGRDDEAPTASLDEAAVATGVPPQEMQRRSAVDLHTELRAAVRDGLLRVGDQVDEATVSLAFAAGPGVVREALSQLVQEGVLERSPEGSPVVAAAISRFSLASGRPYQAHEQAHFHSEVLSSARVAVPPFLTGVLTADAGRIHRDEHVTYRDGRPIMIYVRYSDGRLPACRPLTSETGNPDFAALFAKTYGLPPGRIDSWVHAIRAEEQIARRLQVPPSSVVLHLERVTHDSEGAVRELSHSYVAAGSVALHIHQDVASDHLPA